MAKISDRSLRLLLTGNQVMLWISAVIVMGITSYFIAQFPSPHGEHIIYEEVIVWNATHLLRTLELT
jgi:hypothetical protein